MTPMAKPRDTLFYDGYCGMCRGSIRVLRELDWLGRLGYQDLNTTPVEELPFSLEEALRAMPMRTRDGRGLIGFKAMRRAMIQMPLLIGIAWMLYLPGIAHLGERVYRTVASHRRRACTLPPLGKKPDAGWAR
jgi:predicted DCC family thiol-disulfide oxidoreductase YuxK